MNGLTIRKIKTMPAAGLLFVISTAATMLYFQQELLPASTLQISTGLALTTLISEDLATITAGQLVAIDKIDSTSAILACMIGIIGGDLALWLVGRLIGDRLIRASWLRAKAGHELYQKIESGLDRHPSLLFTARFVPGMRLPVYLLAGATQYSLKRFAMIAIAGSTLWVPVIVLLSSQFGESFTHRFERFAGAGIIAAGLVTMLLVLSIRHFGRSISNKERAYSRWEFWPSWTLYIPVALYMLIRHPIRVGIFGIFRITATNPGIPHSGIIGESKSDILQSMRSSHVLKFQKIERGNTESRVNEIINFMKSHQLDFPIILKPDQGQRGTGVCLVRTIQDTQKYLNENSKTLIAQQYHPGPHEAGVFYYRFPGESSGHIFSITDKIFPQIIGDGVYTVRELILANPRLKMQFKTFAHHHKNILDKVLENAECLKLTIAGNHCQGTLFLDGRDLITPELCRALDQVVDTFPGFYFGRFDLRYTDAAAFRMGRDFAIVELNGLTSESTNIYDPRKSYFRAIMTLVQQWTLALSIAEMNVRNARHIRKV